MAWIIATAVVVQACTPSPEGTVDRTASVEFQARTYDVGYATELQIDDQDISGVGELGANFPLANGRQVFALAGIDPARVIVLKALPGEASGYLVGYARGAVPDGQPNEEQAQTARRFLSAIPELCEFYVAPPAGAC